MSDAIRITGIEMGRNPARDLPISAGALICGACPEPSTGHEPVAGNRHTGAALFTIEEAS